MPTGTPHEPVDANGKPLGGAALESWRRAEAERRAAAEAREDVAALARVVCRLAGRVTGLPATDGVRAVASLAGQDGAEAALRCLRAAGLDPDPQARRWAAEAPRQRQASYRPGDLYAGDPAHDPRVTAAILAGEPMDAVADLTAQVTAERRREAEEAEAALPVPPDVLWMTREGKAVREGSGHGAPLTAQRSIVRREVPERAGVRGGGTGAARRRVRS